MLEPPKQLTINFKLIYSSKSIFSPVTSLVSTVYTFQSLDSLVIFFHQDIQGIESPSASHFAIKVGMGLVGRAQGYL